jgi:hypothetical protein
MVSAIQCIEETPMLVSADEKGILRVIFYYNRCGISELNNVYKPYKLIPKLTSTNSSMFRVSRNWLLLAKDLH